MKTFKIIERDRTYTFNLGNIDCAECSPNGEGWKLVMDYGSKQYTFLYHKKSEADQIYNEITKAME